jgi:hypothetical protein
MKLKHINLRESADSNSEKSAPGRIVSFQAVRAGHVLDARCPNPEDSKLKEKAIAAMEAAVKYVLTDEDAEVETVAQEDRRKFGGTTKWSKLYPISRKTNDGIRIEYWQTATKNLMGRSLTSLRDIQQRPVQVPLEKLGLRVSPEHFYRGQFENELQQLANNNILLGWPQNWEIDTTIPGRDIIISLNNQ